MGSAAVCVVGAGAAGLWAAMRIAGSGRSVLLLEKTARTGTKILASGGTRCNVTTSLTGSEAARAFGSREAERFLAPAFKALPPQRLRDVFQGLGVPTVVEEEFDKVFPASHRAVDVRDALEREARRLGVEIRLDTPVTGVEPEAEGFRVHHLGGTLLAPQVLLSPGGKSYPGTGTTGDGYGWLEALDLAVVEPVPALVPLVAEAAWVRELQGVRVDGVEVRLLDPGGKEVWPAGSSVATRRPVLFTHFGLSGPGILDISIHVARARAPGFVVALDLAPDVTAEGLERSLIEAAGAPGRRSVGSLLPPGIPKRLLGPILGQAGAPAVLSGLTRETRRRLVEALKGLRIPVAGTLGFARAEVTAGGLALSEVDRKTMEVRKYPGLFAFGEILDIQGPIGGFNFQAAFATAEMAALAVGRRG